MAAPCRKCGATKTEPFRPGLRQKLARQLGYELRRCARCRKTRLLSRRKKRAADAAAPEQATASQAPVAFYDPDGFNGCPRCGDMRFHRSRRGWVQRQVLRQPPMVRCAACGYRFPAPQV
jgi:hypothetical protein